MINFLPFSIYFAGALISIFLKARLKSIAAIVISLIAFLNILYFSPQVGFKVELLGFDAILLNADNLSLFFAYIFAFLFFLTIIYSYSEMKKTFHLFAFVYAGSAFAILFAGDFLTFFIFWEIMMIAAVVLICLDKNPKSYASAYRYLIVHLMGGGILLAGILLNYHYVGTMQISNLHAGLPSILIFIGIAVNAAFFPVHFWVPDAYSNAPVTSSVLLSIFTTKISIYSFLRFFPGTEALLYLGIAIVIIGSIFSMFQNDLRRTISYLILSSIGFMAIAIGVGNNVGADAAMFYAWNHLFYNALLFMTAGVLIGTFGSAQLDSIAISLAKMPVTFICLIIGVFAVAGIPPFNGFVSKVFLFSSLYDYPVVYWIMKLSTVFISVSMFRIVYFSLISKERISNFMNEKSYQIIPMLVVASAVLLTGIAPDTFVAPLGNGYNLMSYINIKSIFDSITVNLLAIAIFLLGKKSIFSLNTKTLKDIDSIYSFLTSEFFLFVKSPCLIFISWLQAFSYTYFVLMSKLYPKNKTFRLNAETSIKSAADNRNKVRNNHAALEYVSLGASLFLTAVVVLIFLVILLSRKI